MTEILVHKTRTEVIASLVAEADRARVPDDITYAVRESFSILAVPGSPPPSRDEIRRRGEMAIEMWIELRAECEYTLDQLRATLPQLLVRRILGIPWEPEGACKRKDRRRRLWSPDAHQTALHNEFGAPKVDGRHVTHELGSLGFLRVDG
jgi:hypothetical protein